MSGLEWMDGAVCAQVDGDAMYPTKGESPKPSKQVCRFCSVKAECLTYALDNDLRYGIWGGLTDRERRLVRRGRVAA